MPSCASWKNVAPEGEFPSGRSAESSALVDMEIWNLNFNSGPYARSLAPCLRTCALDIKSTNAARDPRRTRVIESALFRTPRFAHPILQDLYIKHCLNGLFYRSGGKEVPLPKGSFAQICSFFARYPNILLIRTIRTQPFSEFDVSSLDPGVSRRGGSDGRHTWKVRKRPEPIAHFTRSLSSCCRNCGPTLG